MTKNEREMGCEYLAIRVDDSQEGNNLKGHAGLVHSPVLIVYTTTTKKKKSKYRENK